MTLSLHRRWLRGPQSGAYHHRRDTDALVDRQRWRSVWRAAAEGAGLGRDITVAAGVTTITPELVSVSAARPTVLIARLLAGQLAEDVAQVADRLAGPLGAQRVRVQALSDGVHCRLTLLDRDPLADVFRPTLVPATSALDPVILGRDEDGVTIAHALAEPAHLAIQGMNGSGKSRWSYGLLSQLAHADDVLISGSDITGLLLGPPFDGTRHRAHQAAGAADLEHHARVLEQLVADMDRRLGAMPRGADKIDPTPDTPLVVVVAEEWPGLLRAAEAREKKLAARITSAMLRLASEGRKAAFRCVVLAQRFEAAAVGGGYLREQLGLTISFRVPADSLAFLHGDDARELGATHRIAEPGIAVVSAPGRPITRMRAPWFGEYAEYVEAVGGEQMSPPGHYPHSGDGGGAS